MYLIVCLDLKNGLRFNNRRQSRDSRVIERICDITGNSKLLIQKSSEVLFAPPYSNLIISSDPLKDADTADYCFIERGADITSIDDIEKIIVYRWDKVYPQDEKFPIDLKEWKLISKHEFSGTSHDMITEEIYSK